MSRLALAGVVATVAIVALVVAYVARDDEYALQVAAGLGTTLALAFPLFWLEQRFEQRVSKEVTHQVGDVKDQLQDVQVAFGKRVDELAQRLDEEIEDRRAADIEEALGPAVRVRHDRSFDSTYEALEHGNRGAIKDLVFVLLREQGLTVRVRVGDCQDRRCIDVIAIRDGDRKRVSLVWSEREEVNDMFVALDAALRAKLGRTAPKKVPWLSALDRLSRTLEFAEQRRLDAGEEPVDPLRAKLNGEWYVTEFSLEYDGETPRSFDITDLSRATDSGRFPVVDGAEPAEVEYAFRAAYRIVLDRL